MPQRRKPSRRLRRLRRVATVVFVVVLAWLLLRFLGSRDGDPSGRGDDETTVDSATTTSVSTPTLMQAFQLTALSDATTPTRPRPGATGPDDAEASATETFDHAKGIVRGRLVHEDGRPVAGATVRAVPALDDGHFAGLRPVRPATTSRSDAIGHFQVVAPIAVGGGVRLVIDVGDVRHLSDVFTPVSQGIFRLSDLRLPPPRSIVVRGTNLDSERSTTNILLRPAAPSTPFGRAPWRATTRNVPPSMRVPRPNDAKGITFDNVGRGAWEVVVTRNGGVESRLCRAGDDIDIGSVPPEVATTISVRPPETVTIISPKRRRVVEGSSSGDIRVPTWMRHDETAVILRAGHDPIPFVASLEGDVLDLSSSTASVVVRATAPADWQPRFEPLMPTPIRRFVDELTAARRPTTTVGGNRTLRLAPGTYRLQWEHAGGGVRATDDVDVRGDGSTTHVRFADAVRSRRVRGAVTDAAGRVVSDARVFLGRSLDVALDTISNPDVPWFRLTDATGHFEWSDLGAGAWELLVTTPRHRPVRQNLVVDEAADAEVIVDVELESGPALRVELDDASGRVLGGFEIALINARGQVLRAKTDAATGVATFEELAPGTYVAMVVFGRLSVPLDDWAWLREKAGGKLVVVDAAPVTLRWTLPPPAPFRARLSWPAHDPATLQIVHAGAAPVPGVWPDLSLGLVHPGEIEIDRLLPGRYRALARRDDRIDVVDFEFAATDDVVNLHFAFPDRR